MENFIQKIKKNYRDHFNTTNKPPESISDFMQGLGEDEEAFKKYYKSFSDLDKEIWKDLAKSTESRIKEEEVYVEYSVREKMLSFLYTLVEEMKLDRAFIKYQFKHKKNGRIGITPVFLDDFREEFMSFSHEIVNEGLDTTEIINRPFISEKYAEALWLEVLFLISFWIRDESENGEQTDAAIEKTSNLAFDLLGQTPIDSAFDLVRFLIQRK